MKLGIISDIHGNLDALNAIVKRLEAERVDEIYCLGDVVGYGANPNECLEKVRAICKICLLGNHDDAVNGGTNTRYFNPYAQAAIEWTNRVLTDENRAFLKVRPLSHEEPNYLYVHATPLEPRNWNYCLTDHEAADQWPLLKPGMTAFIGHSHIPVEFTHESDRKRVINVGSVGQPRDHDPRASCGLLETETGTFRWIREVYPIQEAARKIRQANLPEYLAARLFEGT